jgi:hypothetical protein
MRCKGGKWIGAEQGLLSSFSDDGDEISGFLRIMNLTAEWPGNA